MFSSLLAICRFLFPFPFSFAAQGLLGLFFLTLWQCFWSHLKHKQFFEPRISQQCSLCCRKTILAWYFLQNKKLDWIRHWNSATNTKTSEKTLLWLNLLILKLRHYYMSQAIDQLWNVWFSVILMSFSDRELGCWSKKKKITSSDMVNTWTIGHCKLFVLLCGLSFLILSKRGISSFSQHVLSHKCGITKALCGHSSEDLLRRKTKVTTGWLLS